MSFHFKVHVLLSIFFFVFCCFVSYKHPYLISTWPLDSIHTPNSFVQWQIKHFPKLKRVLIVKFRFQFFFSFGFAFFWNSIEWEFQFKIIKFFVCFHLIWNHHTGWVWGIEKRHLFESNKRIRNTIERIRVTILWQFIC